MDDDHRLTPVGNTLLSRFLRSVGGIASGPRVAVAIGVVVVAWIAVYALAGFPTWMAVSLQVVAAAVTLVMVFVILHMQRRSEVAMQLKLDALIRASEADDELAEIERTEGDELERHRLHPAEGPEAEPDAGRRRGPSGSLRV